MFYAWIVLLIFYSVMLGVHIARGSWLALFFVPMVGLAVYWIRANRKLIVLPQIPPKPETLSQRFAQGYKPSFREEA